jgi:hypothetical protein
MRNLPVGVLAEISLLFCSSSPLVNENQLGIPALGIAQTCSLWRDVALHTPMLWADMSVNIAYPQSRLVDLYLLQSKSALWLSNGVDR